MAQHQALQWFSDGYDLTAPWGKSFLRAPQFLQAAVAALPIPGSIYHKMCFAHCFRCPEVS